MLAKGKTWLLGGLARVYAVLALFALIHLGVLLGIAAYAYHSGRIDRDKMAKIMALIRGDELEAGAADEPEGSAAAPEGSTETSAQVITDNTTKEDMVQLERQRARADVYNLSIMVDRRALKLQKDQEAHSRAVTLHEEQMRQRQEQELSDSHTKTIDTIGALDPKRARDFLMNTSDADVLTVLLSLPDRKRKRILGSCKTQDQTQWRDRVLNAMLKERPRQSGGA